MSEVDWEAVRTAMRGLLDTEAEEMDALIESISSQESEEAHVVDIALGLSLYVLGSEVTLEQAINVRDSLNDLPLDALAFTLETLKAGAEPEHELTKDCWCGPTVSDILSYEQDAGL